jgi:hypothetical protein
MCIAVFRHEGDNRKGIATRYDVDNVVVRVAGDDQLARGAITASLSVKI